GPTCQRTACSAAPYLGRPLGLAGRGDQLDHPRGAFAVDRVPRVAVDLEARADDGAVDEVEHLADGVVVDARVGEHGDAADRLFRLPQVGHVGADTGSLA